MDNLNLLTLDLLHSALATVASAPDAEYPYQVGFWWIFSPLKHYNTITNNYALTEVPWHNIPAWGMYYLDLRVVAASLAVLLTTFIIIPLLARGTASHPPRILWLSGGTGIAFAAIFVQHGFKLSTSWVNLAYILTVSLLVAIFFKLAKSRPVEAQQ